MKKVLLIGVVGVFLIYMSCNESTTVGSELIIDEDIDRGFTDTIAFHAKTITSDPIPTYFTPGFINSNFMIGELDDPIFGKTTSSVYFDMGLASGPGFNGGTLDSMVMTFALNPNGFYGDSIVEHTIKVWELEERLDGLDTIFSDDKFRIEGSNNGPIASAENLIPSKTDSVPYIAYVNGNEVNGPPQIRMTVDTEFAQKIFADTIALASLDGLLDLVNGFVVTSTPANGNSMIGLNMNEANPFTGIEVYFETNAGTKAVRRFVFRGRRPQNFELNQESAANKSFLNRDITNGDPLFVQGMSGVITEFDLSGIAAVDNEVLNLAELEVFVFDGFENDNPSIFPLPSFLSLIKASDGSEINDLLFGRFNGSVEILFGGNLKSSDIEGVRSYTMTLTSYLKDVQEGKEDGKLRLEVLDKAQSPRRVILYGPGHAELAPRLKVSFTIP